MLLDTTSQTNVSKKWKWMKFKWFQENVEFVETRVIIAKIALILILHVSGIFVVFFFG